MTVAAPPALSNQEVARYSRHLIMPEVGMDGQLKLKAASVLCIGAGGLGSPVAMYLAAAGVGRLGIVDFDVVDYSNLQRQVIHGTPDVGRSKLDSARDTLNAINPEVRIETHDVALSSSNALDVLRGYDVIVDGTDNFPTRYLVNDACVILGIPNAYGSIFRFEGQASVFAAKDGPCYRCLYPEPPPPGLVPSCAEGGVLGILPGVVGTIQATEAVKLIMGVGEPLIGRFLVYDALRMRFRELKLRKDPDCPVCGDNPTVTELIDYEQFCGITPAAPAPEPAAGDADDATVEQLKARLDAGDGVFILDVREPQEYQICAIPGSTLIPLGDLPSRLHELRGARRNDRPLQVGRAQRQGGQAAPRGRLRAGEEPARRHPALDRRRRPVAAEVLRPDVRWSFGSIGLLGRKRHEHRRAARRFRPGAVQASGGSGAGPAAAREGSLRDDEDRGCGGAGADPSPAAARRRPPRRSAVGVGPPRPDLAAVLDPEGVPPLGGPTGLGRRLRRVSRSARRGLAPVSQGAGARGTADLRGHFSRLHQRSEYLGRVLSCLCSQHGARSDSGGAGRLSYWGIAQSEPRPM